MPLESVTCFNTRVKDLAPLQEMPLKGLNCMSTAVDDLTPLGTTRQLEELVLYGNRGVRDLTPLRGLPLKSLTISGTAVSDLSPLAGMPLEKIVCDPSVSAQPANAKLLRTITTLASINKQPPAEFWKQVDAGKTPGSSMLPAEAVKPGQPLTVDLGGGVTMEFVRIEALKGWVGKYEVTIEQLRRCPKVEKLSFPPVDGVDLNADGLPAPGGIYNGVKSFADWMNTCRLPAGYQARLPTDNEWTCFAQCGDNRKYPWGNDWPPRFGNYASIAGYADAFPAACPVEQSGRNDWGLYGVGGNLAEWTTDAHGDGILRGGSWLSSQPQDLLISARHKGDFPNRLCQGGRIVVMPETAAAEFWKR
jgi:hypothetical protein